MAGRRILIVDDEIAEYEGFVGDLRRRGHVVGTAEDAAGALALLAEGEYDVLVIDIVLPGVDGFQLLGRIRGQSRTSHLPAIMITGPAAGPDTMARAMRDGRTSYVEKPITVSALMAEIERALDHGEETGTWDVSVRPKAHGRRQHRKGVIS